MLVKKILVFSVLLMPVMTLAESIAQSPVFSEEPTATLYETTSINASPNLYVLKSGNLQINYSSSGIDGKPHFSYKKGKTTLNFSGDEIRTVETDLGTVVSVTTIMTIDNGSTSFSVLIPNIYLDGSSIGSTTKIKTQAIETKHKSNISNKGQLDSYSVFNLTGKVSLVAF